MANWVADFLIRNSDISALPIAGRHRHSIHFERNNGERIAFFTGMPCHFQDTDGLWKPLDTSLQPATDGFYGSPGLDVLIHLDGRVKVEGSNYQQLTDLPSSPLGFLDGDSIIREFPGGKQILRLLENGFREQILLYKKTFPFDKFLVKKQGILPSKFIEYPLIATDNNGVKFVFMGDAVAFASWMDQAAYPVTIDPDFTESTGDADITGQDSTYSIARSTSISFRSTQESIYIGQDTGFLVRRDFLKFDTSSIPDGDTITQVNLKLVCTYDGSTADFDVQIVKQDWSAQDPIADGTREAAYDGCLAGTADNNIWRNTNGMSTNTQYSSGNLSTIWVSKTGFTYYSLRSSEDYINSAPTVSEQIALGAQENATPGYRPILTVAYSTGGPSTSNFFIMF